MRAPFAVAAPLKELIRDGIVERKSYDEVPPRVEYSLTEKGNSVVPILQSICAWFGIFRRNDGGHVLAQCEKCDYNASAVRMEK